MLYAFGRLLAITFFAVIGILFIIGGVRTMGLRNSHAMIEHPIRDLDFYIIAQGGDTEAAPAYSAAAFDAAVQLSPKVWLQANLYLTKDKKWVVAADDYEKSQRLDQLNQSDLPNHLTLEQFLQRYPQPHLVLTLMAKAPGASDQFAKIIKQFNAENRVIVQSTIGSNIEIIRSHGPLWLYGEPDTNYVRLNLLAALYIETIAAIKGDVLFIPTLTDGRLVMRKNLLQEFKRRERLLIVEGDLLSPLKSSSIYSLINGFMTPRPSKALNSL
jgi:hypothetical protein